MSQSWLDFVKYNPLSILTSINNPSLNYFIPREFLKKKSRPDLKYWITFIQYRILMRFFLLKN